VINLKKVLISLFTLGVVAVVAVMATQAFFSDSEKSVDNKFVAGAIDLQIDNTSYAIDFNIPAYPSPTGALVANIANTWTVRDLTVEKFFDFVDLKPGDYGEDTISIHVGSNDAWMCAAAKLTADDDVTCTDPEKVDDPACDNPGVGLGELDEGVNFAFWVDDGDNVYEPVLDNAGGVAESIFLSGPLSGLGAQGQITLADSASSILGATKPVPGGTTFYIGKIWCFGNLTAGALVQDGDATGTPLTKGTTGFVCDGTLVNDAAQTDKVVGDLEFYAEQSRHNSSFLCRNWKPSWTPKP